MSIRTRESRFSYDITARAGYPGQSPPERLQAIHDLVRSGEYHIPAEAIADRMVERMIADKRRRSY